MTDYPPNDECWGWQNAEVQEGCRKGAGRVQGMQSRLAGYVQLLEVHWDWHTVRHVWLVIAIASCRCIHQGYKQCVLCPLVANMMSFCCIVFGFLWKCTVSQFPNLVLGSQWVHKYRYRLCLYFDRKCEVSMLFSYTHSSFTPLQVASL